MACGRYAFARISGGIGSGLPCKSRWRSTFICAILSGRRAIWLLRANSCASRGSCTMPSGKGVDLVCGSGNLDRRAVFTAHEPFAECVAHVEQAQAGHSADSGRQRSQPVVAHFKPTNFPAARSVPVAWRWHCCRRSVTRFSSCARVSGRVDKRLLPMSRSWSWRNRPISSCNVVRQLPRTMKKRSSVSWKSADGNSVRQLAPIPDVWSLLR